MSGPDVERIAAGLTKGNAFVVRFNGRAYGNTPFAASIMRPLERRGLFTRIERKGFQVRWELTPLGLAVRAHIERQNNDQ